MCIEWSTWYWFGEKESTSRPPHSDSTAALEQIPQFDRLTWLSLLVVVDARLGRAIIEGRLVPHIDCPMEKDRLLGDGLPGRKTKKRPPLQVWNKFQFKRIPMVGVVRGSGSVGVVGVFVVAPTKIELVFCKDGFVSVTFVKA